MLSLTSAPLFVHLKRNIRIVRLNVLLTISCLTNISAIELVIRKRHREIFRRNLLSQVHLLVFSISLNEVLGTLHIIFIAKESLEEGLISI
jgi:hypothetical protein